MHPATSMDIQKGGVKTTFIQFRKPTHQFCPHLMITLITTEESKLFLTHVAQFLFGKVIATSVERYKCFRFCSDDILT